MSFEFVPHNHLSHAIRGLDLEEETEEELLGMAASLEERAGLYNRMHPLCPDRVEYLAKAYPLQKGTTIRLWTALAFKGKSIHEICALASNTYKWNFSLSNWFHLEPKHEEKARVYQVIFRPNGYIEATVRFNVVRHIPFEDKRIPHDRSIDVELLFDTQAPKPTVQVWKNLSYGKRAVEIFFSDVFSLTTSGVLPVRFKEDEIEAIAEANNLTHYGMHGDDAFGRLGKVTYLSSPNVDAPGYQPFPSGETRITAQLSTSNDKSMYNFGFLHDDGFFEDVEVIFHFLKRSPKISFSKRTSRHAMMHVINLLR